MSVFRTFRKKEIEFWECIKGYTISELADKFNRNMFWMNDLNLLSKEVIYYFNLFVLISEEFQELPILKCYRKDDAYYYLLEKTSEQLFWGMVMKDYDVEFTFIIDEGLEEIPTKSECHLKDIIATRKDLIVGISEFNELKKGLGLYV